MEEKPKANPLVVQVPLDELTMARLQRMSAELGDEPTSIAASLLHDILKDDEEATGTSYLLN